MRQPFLSYKVLRQRNVQLATWGCEFGGAADQLEFLISLLSRLKTPKPQSRVRSPVSMSSNVLYGLHRSVYTRIAAMTFIEKGVCFELEEIEIFGPSGVPASHLRRHPFGRIPVLKCGEFWLYETHAICRYIDEAFDGPPLQPAEPAARARMAQTIGVLDSYAYRPMVWDVFVQRFDAASLGHEADEIVVASAMPKIRLALFVLESLLGDRHYFGGSSPSLADLHAYPMLALLGRVAEGAATLGEHRALVAWCGRMSVRPSAIQTRTTYETDTRNGAAHASFPR